MKKFMPEVITFVALVAAPLFLLSNTVSAQSYGEGAYGGRTYNEWHVEDQDPKTPPSGGSREEAGQSPEVTIIPEAEENNDSDDRPVDSQSAEGDGLTNETDDTTEQPDGQEETQSDTDKTPSSTIWWSISAVLIALLLLLFALPRRRRRENQ